jgi:hypothetical protein
MRTRLSAVMMIAVIIGAGAWQPGVAQQSAPPGDGQKTVGGPNPSPTPAAPAAVATPIVARPPGNPLRARRASKLIGAKVVNDAGDLVGTIDDLLVGAEQDPVFAVLSVGGFLGVGSQLVVVPLSSLIITPNRVSFPGASKDALEALPPFRYPG